jgi:hypothetical protein
MSRKQAKRSFSISSGTPRPSDNDYINNIHDNVKQFLMTHDNELLDNEKKFFPCLGDPDDSPFDTMAHRICDYQNKQALDLATDFLNKLEEKQKKKLLIMRSCLQLYEELKSAFDEWEMKLRMGCAEHCIFTWSRKGRYSGRPREYVSYEEWAVDSDPYGVIPLFITKLNKRGYRPEIFVATPFYNSKIGIYASETFLCITCAYNESA